MFEDKQTPEHGSYQRVNRQDGVLLLIFSFLSRLSINRSIIKSVNARRVIPVARKNRILRALYSNADSLPMDSNITWSRQSARRSVARTTESRT